jgi:hypothetical protein
MVQGAAKFHQEIEIAWSTRPFSETYLMTGRLEINNTIGEIIITAKGTSVNIRYTKTEGDGTVPVLSVESIMVPSSHIFKFNDVEHDKLPINGTVLSRTLSRIKSV